MVNSPIHHLRQLKKTGIEYFKMQYYYGLLRRLIDKTDAFSHVFGSLIKVDKIDKNIDYQISTDLRERLEKAKNYNKINNMLFKDPPTITFISNFLPRFDKTSADHRLLNILKILLHSSCKIHYIYSSESRNDTKYKEALKGDIAFYHLKLNQHDYQKIIVENKHDYIWITSLWRIEYTEFMSKLIKSLREKSPSVKVIIDTVDFHAKEFYRKYESSKDPKDLATANEFIKYEEVLYKAADTVIVISEEERKDIQEKIRGIRKFAIVPNIHYISDLTRPYHKRRNICFVGHFGNQHNVDAVKYFIENIFDLILKRNPLIEFHIIGHSSEKYKKVFDSHNVRVIGSLKNLQKALTYYKLFVCPMTYGAGMKGKIGAAISAGIPVATTSIGAEGFPVRDGEECFISDLPKEFAEKCNQCLNDLSLWHNFSAKSIIMLAENFSFSIVAEKLRNILMD